jgi:hypothetical protein
MNISTGRHIEARVKQAYLGRSDAIFRHWFEPAGASGIMPLQWSLKPDGARNVPG